MNAVLAFDQLVRGESPAEPDDSLEVENPERVAGNPQTHTAANGHRPFPAFVPELSGFARDFCLASLSKATGAFMIFPRACGRKARTPF